MPVVIFLLQASTFIGGTLAVIQFDRKRRPRMMKEPSTGTLLLLSFLCNIACLPYYFYATRGGGKGIAIGVGLSVGLYVLVVIIGIVGMLVTGAPLPGVS